MRIYGFRAWHSGANQMLKNNHQGFMGDVFNWKHEGQPITIMQWTGLKDKNGVGIYEGDVINDKFDCGQLCVIKYCEKRACFCYERVNEVLFADEQKRSIPISVSPETLCEGNVIGNKWENPELLEAKS